MVQIQYLGRFLDIESDEKITYTIQVQDLADVSSVASSFTTSFKIPKTINNLEAYKSLSLPSDTSNLPYIKNEVKLYDNNTVLINNGWLKINSSDQYFNINIENGIIDFFKAIEGKTIGGNLDLSETNHNKDLVTVIDSFNRNDYCYIIADYNGLNTYIKSNVEYINTDYLVPSLNNLYLWNKIFEYAGYTYEGDIFSNELFTNLWVTYPKAPPTKSDEEGFPEPILRFSSNKTNNIVYVEDYDNLIVKFNLENIVLNGVLFNSNKITIQSTGTYSLESILDGYADYIVEDNWGYPVGSEKSYFKPALLINGVLNTYNSQINSVNLRSGDIVEIICHWYYLGGGYINGIRELKFNSYNVKLTQVSQSIIDFGKEFLDISISEYVKENMIRFALTPFIDVEKKHIKFLSLSERIKETNVIDWTDKFIDRTNETYTYRDYAQRNVLKHKYNDENANFNNGSILVNNKNLEDSKDLYSSKFYSYNNEVTTFYSNDFKNNSFPIWNREIKEIINNDTNEKTYEVSYKGLSNRFYFIRRKDLNKEIKIGSQLLKIEESVNNVKIAEILNLSYSEAINNYSEFSKVLSDTRIHEIDLFLDINDLLNLDLKSLYYFSQENQYYILNRLTIDLKNRETKGEFIRVKYSI